MATIYRRMGDIGTVKGKRVLVRVDFNVPIDSVSGEITDDSRIVGSMPTLKKLLQQGARVIAISHRGRPASAAASESLRPVVGYLRAHMGFPVAFSGTVGSEEAGQAVRALRDGEMLLLENLRFSPGETANSLEFSETLAGYADLYVNDAFGTSHRNHASIVGVPRLLPSYAGFLMAQEIDHLTHILAAPRPPYWAIIGGAKVSDKVKLLGRLLDLVNGLMIGGGMANTFLSAEGFSMGASLVEEEAVDRAKGLLAKARARGIAVILPTDLVVAEKFAAHAPWRVCEVGGVKPGEMALDIGPRTIAEMVRALASARTVLWNGPMGVFEFDAFSRGTLEVARALGHSHAAVVVGGGDSVAAVGKAGVKDMMTHISTGGGATLRFLEGEDLPGIHALKQWPDPAERTAE